MQCFLYQSVNESMLLLIGILVLFFRFLIDNLKLIFPIVTEQAVCGVDQGKAASDPVNTGV